LLSKQHSYPCFKKEKQLMIFESNNKSLKKNCIFESCLQKFDRKLYE
jgi:hypothetical protein